MYKAMLIVSKKKKLQQWKKYDIRESNMYLLDELFSSNSSADYSAFKKYIALRKYNNTFHPEESIVFDSKHDITCFIHTQ